MLMVFFDRYATILADSPDSLGRGVFSRMIYRFLGLLFFDCPVKSNDLSVHWQLG